MATHSHGSTLKVDGNGDSTYEDIAEVVSTDGPHMETTVSPSWHLGSTSGVKTFLPGLVDPGELACVLRFTKAQHNTFVGYLRSSKPWKVTLADGSTITFSGFFKTLGAPVAADDDTINCEYAIKVTGAVTFTAAP